LFPLRLTRATPSPEFGYRTRIITDGVHVSVSAAREVHRLTVTVAASSSTR
jgi:hypothetical protein